ncbi:MAG TPA: alpha/beta fold hydrolase [Bryobacteraceae bacterium]|nr:alpha/beta fold hydrolase [Bryobacteraceae bacterium]
MTHAEQSLGLRPGAFPFESHFRTAGGAIVHYVDEGLGPTLFMVHGNPTWSFLYRHVIGALRPRFRCIAIDLPGFGLSQPPPGFSFLPEDHAVVVAALLADLGIKDATLVAHDWGGPIGLTAAFAEPGRLTRFALGNTWAWPVNGDWHFEWFSRLMGGPLGRFGARRWNLFVNGVMVWSMRRGPLTMEAKRAYQAPLRDPARRTGTHIFPAAITGSRDFLRGIEARLGELDGRDFLFLWPDGDIAFRAPELRRWRALYPKAQVVPISNCGHYVFEEAGPECAAALMQWLAPRAPGEAISAPFQPN